MVARALILAAGKGVSIADAEVPNCLATVGRCSVLERTLELLEDMGVGRIGITIGFEGAAVRRHVASSPVLSAAISGA
jgi:choline kinase